MFKKLLLVSVLVGSACAMNENAVPAADDGAGVALAAAPQGDAPVAAAQPGIFRRGADGALYCLNTAWTRVDRTTRISAVASKDEWTGHYLKNGAKVLVCAVLLYGAYKLLTYKKKETPAEPTSVITNEKAEVPATA